MRRNSKRKIILAAGITLVAILLFWLVLRFVVNSSLLDEQFGDSGEWGGSGEDEEVYLTIDDKDYISNDDIEVYVAGYRRREQRYRHDGENVTHGAVHGRVSYLCYPAFLCTQKIDRELSGAKRKGTRKDPRTDSGGARAA